MPALGDKDLAASRSRPLAAAQAAQSAQTVDWARRSPKGGEQLHRFSTVPAGPRPVALAGRDAREVTMERRLPAPIAELDADFQRFVERFRGPLPLPPVAGQQAEVLVILPTCHSPSRETISRLEQIASALRQYSSARSDSASPRLVRGNVQEQAQLLRFVARRASQSRQHPFPKFHSPLKMARSQEIGIQRRVEFGSRSNRSSGRTPAPSPVVAFQACRRAGQFLVGWRRPTKTAGRSFRPPGRRWRTWPPPGPVAPREKRIPAGDEQPPVKSAPIATYSASPG